MSVGIFGHAPRKAWAVPVLIFGVVVACGLALSSTSASGDATLPAKTAAQLLAAVQGSSNVNLSGTVVETARLGLPSLPDTAGGGASLSWESLVTGTHTAQVSMAGPDKQRVALLGSLSESDVIRNGPDLWTYSSDGNQVSHTTLPPPSDARSSSAASAGAESYTPAGAARQVLAAIDPSTIVTVDPSQLVAGRKAYTLVLTPRDSRSTVRKVAISIDGSRYVPLRVQVFGTASSAAFQTGFSNVSFSTPKSSVFDFHPPAGATTVADPFGLSGPGKHHDQGATPNLPAVPSASPTAQQSVIGTGWTSIIELPQGLPAGTNGGLLHDATTPVGTTGDRLITTSLVNALILPDGRVFLGAVTPTLLEQTAAATPR
jgi:outer membrane lipoprotein-sorting protein